MSYNRKIILYSIIMLIAASAVFCYQYLLNPGSELLAVQSEKVGLENEETRSEIDIPKEKVKTFSFTIGGDVMFDRGVDANFRGDKIFQIFDNLSPNIFAGKDLGLINLEGPISESEILYDNTYNNLTFNFPPKSGQVLKELEINVAGLANNHTLNNGKSGLEYTKEHLTSIGIIPIGQQKGFDSDSVRRFGEEDLTVSLIAVDCLEDDCNSINAEISEENKITDFQIIFPHWGTEYAPKHSSAQENTAKAWIDAGADMVVGSHPHVVQDAEVYKNKPIFYSLGNLLFDQTFSKETMEGLIISGEITKEELKIQLHPTRSIKFKPTFLAGEELDNFIASYYQNLGQTYDLTVDNSLIFNYANN